MLHRKALTQAVRPVSLAVLLALGFSSLVASAQVPVVEAGSRRGQSEAAQPQGNDLMMTLYNQVEALQEEVQALRGLVEEQANHLRRVQTEQRDRYLDVDRRLSELSGGAAVGALPGATAPEGPGAIAGASTLPPATAGASPPPAANAPASVTPPPAVSLGNAAPASSAAMVSQTPPAASETPAAPALGAELGEQDLYRTALNMLLEQNQHEQSVQLFQAYIDRFPQGRLLTNAYYWQGEALILVPRLEQARDVFTHLIEAYPQDPKAAGAMLKLGVVYQQMGDRARAEQTWREIATRYPESVTEIRDAQNRLSRR